MTKDTDLKHFHNLLTKLEGGGFSDDCDRKMANCIKEISDACLDRAGTHKAELTIKIKFEMNHKDKVVEIYPDLQEKLPKAPRGRGGLYYCNADGFLTRENPRQLTLEDELEKRRMEQAEKAYDMTS